MAEFLNDNVKYLRKEKGISQQELADKIGIDRSTISRIENNEIETTIPIVEKIAKYFNIEFADLVSKDLTTGKNKIIDELELLFSKHKDILTDDDKETMKFLIKKRIREIDKQNNNE